MDQDRVPKHLGNNEHHVLVVEKDPLQGHLLKVSLEEFGWVVRLADDPREALHYCEHDLFDISVINCSYPGHVSGFELSAILRRQYGLASLMITGNLQSELKKRPWFNSGQELLFKPYRLFECSRKLQRLLTAPVGWDEYLSAL